MKRIGIPWPNAVVVEGPTRDSPFEMRGDETMVSGIRLRDWFSDDEIATIAGFKLEKRRREWVVSRLAAKQLALERGACSDPLDCHIGVGVLTSRGSEAAFVSVSHSEPYAAAAIDSVPIGIDVQVVRDLAAGAAHLFLTRDEMQSMERCTIAHRLLHFWCAKEAAWKARRGKVPTMKQVPILLREESASRLSFDCVETFATGEIIVALSR